MLKNVHFQGIKSLLDVNVDLARFTVIVGPNGCGKSTLLDQVEALCASSQFNAKQRHVLGEAGSALSELDPPTAATHGSTGPAVWAGEDDAGGVLSVECPSPRDRGWYDTLRIKASTAAHTHTASAQNMPPEKRRAFDEFLLKRFSWRAQRLRLVPDMIARPVDARVKALHPSGFGLAAVLAALGLDDQDAYGSVQSDLRTIVEHFEKLQMSRPEVLDEKGVPHGGVALGLMLRGAGLQPATAISDGTLLALALLTATHNKDMPPIILMDDIDHGLHLGAQVALVKAIRKVMEVRSDLQVICTSHSPFLLQEMPAEDVRVMALDKEGHAHVRPLIEHPEYDRWSKVMNTGEVWANLGEDWVVDGQ